MLVDINRAVTLGSLDRYELAFAAAMEARRLANQVGMAIRLAQAHSTPGELLLRPGAGTRR